MQFFACLMCRALPFYRRREAWNKLLYQKFTQADRHTQLNNADTPEGSFACLQKEQFDQSERELLSYSPCMLAQLLAQTACLYTDPNTLQGRSELKWKLRQLSPVPSKVLEECISHGVAFHHAGTEKLMCLCIYDVVHHFRISKGFWMLSCVLG